MGLSDKLVASLKENGFERASDIQEKTIPIILEGKDLFAQAETGSGKTGSFAIPVLEQIVREPEKDHLYIVLSPTRELAQQTHKVFREFGTSLDIDSICVIGGESFDKQKKHMGKNPDIVVGTPGRICDLIKQKVIDSKKCDCVIFDEADRLFEMGFSKDNEFVLKNVSPKRQLIMVSATNNQEVFRTAYKFHSHPEEIKLNEDDLMVDKINHKVAMISEEEKMPFLVNLLRQHEDAYSIIFCNTQYMTSLVAIWLERMGFKVKPISGRLPQSKRTRLLQDFRDKKITTLVCTDVAARGLDIDDVNLVVNYDMPHEAPNYVHRVGRTGRAGKEGLAIGFVGFDDCENLDDISEYIGDSIPKMDIEDKDFATDLVKKPYIDGKTLKPKDLNRSQNKNQNNKIVKKVHKPKTKKVMPEKESRQERKKEDVKVYEKNFEFWSSSEKEATEKALKFFRVRDEELLDYEVIKTGKKKFIFFGPQEKFYKFRVKPIFKRVLLPFLIDLFKKMGLRIYAKVSYREPQITIHLSGQDVGLLLKNRFALQNAVKELSYKFLRYRVTMTSETKINVKTQADDNRSPRKGKGQHSNQRAKGFSDEELIAIADKLKEKVEKTQAPAKSESLNPAQRRIIHQYINESDQFQSSSIGDGRFKEVEISLR